MVLTASAGAFPGLVEALREIPVKLEERPLITFAPPDDWSSVDAALDRASSYAAVAFTSPRAARAVVQRIKAVQHSWNPGPDSPTMWAIGPATASALGEVLGQVHVPVSLPGGKPGTGEALARAMLDTDLKGPVLFFCGELRRDDLPNELRNAGIEVDEVVCYRTVLADESAARGAAARGRVLVVASPSVVDLLARSCAKPYQAELLAVGPTTAARARALGWVPAAVAGEPSAMALVSALRGMLANR